MKLISRITDFIEVNNQTFVHYVKGKKYFCLSTENEKDLEILKKIYRSPQFEIKKGIYVFDWYLERKDYFPLEKGLDRNKFLIREIDESTIATTYEKLGKRIDILWDKIINYGNEEGVNQNKG